MRFSLLFWQDRRFGMSQRWLGGDTKKYGLLSRPPKSFELEGQHQNLQRCQWNHPFGLVKKKSRHGCLSKLFEKLPAENQQPGTPRTPLYRFPLKMLPHPNRKRFIRDKCAAMLCMWWLSAITAALKKKECWDSLCFVDPEVSRYPFEWIEFQFWHWFSSYTLKCQPGSTAGTSIKELTRFVSSFSSWKSWAPHPPKVFAKLSYKRMQRNVFCHVLPSSRYQMVLSIIYLISSLFALDRFATSSCCISHPHRGDHQLFFGLVRWPIPFNPRSIVEGNFWTRP